VAGKKEKKMRERQAKSNQQWQVSDQRNVFVSLKEMQICNGQCLEPTVKK